MRRRITPFAIVLTLLAIGISSLIFVGKTEKADANHTCPHNVGFQLYGRDENCGYFLNSYVSATGSGLLTGIPDQFGADALLGVNDINRFVEVMRYHVQQSNGCIPNGSANSDQRRNSAAFIILTMQGAPAGTVANGPCVTSYSFARWENLVRQYASRGLINFNENHTYQFNTRIQRSTMDVAWYSQAWDTRASIVVRAPNGAVIYAIKKDCANPVGIPGSLVPLDQPLTITCGGTTPTTVVAGQAFTLRMSFTTSGGSGPDARYTIFVNLPAAGVSNGIAALFGFVPRNGGTGSGQLPNAIRPAALRINTPGVHSGSFRAEVTDATNSPRTCPFTIEVVEAPYHKVYGGDVVAGAGLGGSCINTAAALIGRHNESASPAHAGAGTQLAAKALSAVVAFASGQARAPTDYNHLTFANPPPSGLIYGGNLSQNHVSCAEELWTPTGTNRGNNVTLNNPGDGDHQATGNVTLNGFNLSMSQRTTLYVQGNVYITGPIRQASGSFNGIDQIPSFRLIVRGGSIYVAPGATELNGLYAAIPTAAGNGRFYTCARSFAIPDQTLLDNGCRTNNLEVYGAVIAELIKFNRTGGSVRHACTAERYNVVCPSGQVPAERFIYTPELWLTSDFNNDPGTVDSIRSLPPVL